MNGFRGGVLGALAVLAAGRIARVVVDQRRERAAMEAHLVTLRAWSESMRQVFGGE